MHALRGAIRQFARGGFTLVEVVVSVSVASILFVAIGSIIVLTARAFPAGEHGATGSATVADVLGLLASDAAYAIGISEAEPDAVEFSVPDRDGDALPETIRYEWAGDAGDPLERTYNGATAKLLDSIDGFSLRYGVRTVTVSFPTSPVTGSESAMVEYSASSSDRVVSQSEQFGQYFLPSLAADATAWTLTKFRIQLKQYNIVQSSSTIELRLADANGLPTGTVLASFTVAESSLPTTLQWREFTPSPPVKFKPSQGVCIVIRASSATYPAEVGYTSSRAAASGELGLYSNTAGVTWSASSTWGMNYTIYGTVTTTGTRTEQHEYLTEIEADLAPSGAGHVPSSATVHVLCEPELP